MLQLRTLGCLYPGRRSRRLVSGWLQSQQGSSERTAKRSETVEMCSQPHLPGNYVAVPHVAPALVLHEWSEEPRRKQSRSMPLPTTTTLPIRAQWECQNENFETGHLFSIVKLNFNVGLFSCIFWFEAIFISKSAIFCRSLFTREKGPK